MSAAADTVQLAINQQRLVQNLRHAFSNRDTVLGELMQNGRRAGASAIHFEYDAQAMRLTVIDDGCGIEDLSKLLTVAESGWDEAVCEREHPYGMGFLSALYSAKFLVVESRGRRLAAECETILAFEPVSIARGEIDRGVRLTLEGFDVSGTGSPVAALSELTSKLERLAAGFPLPVFVNGEPLDRPFAVGEGFVDTRIGHVRLNTRPHTGSPVAFLQGLPVEGLAHPRVVARDRDVVHLDSRLYHARMPDRDKLIDAARVSREVAAVVSELRKQYLAAQKADLTPEEFIRKHFDACLCWGAASLLDDIPLLPSEFVGEFTKTQRLAIDGEEGDPGMEFHCGGFLRREEVESGSVRLVATDEPEEDKSFAARCFSVASGRRPVDPWDLKRLSPAHWVHEHVLDLRDEWDDEEAAAVSVELVNAQQRVSYSGRCVWACVVFCEAIRLTHGEETVEIRDQAIYLDLDGQMVVALPDGEDNTDVVCQITNFCDENALYVEEDEDQERDAFALFLTEHRTSSPEAYFQRMLAQRVGVPPEILRGKRFQVSFDEFGSLAEVTLLDA